MDIILASKSPRRKEILQTMGIDFSVDAVEVDENVQAGTLPQNAVCEISKRKADAVAQKYNDKDVLVISSDTVVVLDGKIIGKPKDKKDAFEILSALSGKTHTVYTGFTVSCKGKTVSDFEATQVKFKTLPQEIIKAYIDTGEPMDKAGAYGIQQKGNLLVEYIHGDFYNVMGLPISKICVTIKGNFGINLLY